MRTPGTTVPLSPSARYGMAPLVVGRWDGVRSRRMVALAIDFCIVGFLCAFVLPVLLLVLAAPLGPLFSLGSLAISWFLVPPMFPLIAFFYNGLTVAGRRMATPGMRMVDLEVRDVDGGRASFISAALHAVLFYLSWLFPAVFLISLISADKSCLHDILAMVRVGRR